MRVGILPLVLVALMALLPSVTSAAATAAGRTAAVRQAWSFEAPFEDYTNAAPVAFGQGRVFAAFCTNQSALVALNATDGPRLWAASRNVSGDGACAFGTAYDAGRVFVSGATAVSAFNASTGAQLWSAPAAQFADGEGIVVGGGLVFILFPEDAVLAFDAANGTLRWSFAPDRIMCRQTPAYDATLRRLFLAGTNGSVTALDATSGAWLWAAPAGSADYAMMRGLAVACGVVVVPDFAENRLVGISAANGSAVWSTGLSSPFAQPLALGAPRCVAIEPSIDHALLALHVSNGSALWADVGPGKFDGSYARPCAGDDGAVVWTAGGDVVSAFDARSTGATLGNATAAYNTNAPPKYTTCSPDGTGVFFRASGVVYAFRRS